MRKLLTLDERMLLRLERMLIHSIPKYARLSKQRSKLMRFFGILLFFNKNFMTDYVTTVYPTVYFPDKDKYNTAYVWPVLAHEWVHLLRAKKHPVLFSLSYAFPQWLALLALVSLVAIWSSPLWLLNLLWLLCLAPLPAFGRYHEEWLAYRMSMAVEVWRYGNVTRYSKNWYVKQFTGPFYYFMWPFKAYLTTKVTTEIASIREGTYDNQYPYSEVRKLIQTIWPITGER